MNSWSFTGNLGRDAEQQYTPQGKSVCKFSVAVKVGFGDKATTTWANCSLWGKQAESLAPYLKKGQQVGITGEVSLREWTDKDGGKRQNLDVNVRDVTLMGGKSKDVEDRPEPVPASKPAASSGNIADMEDDIPF